MKPANLIKYIVMASVIVILVDSMPRRGVSDDTDIFLNPVTNSPPPAVAILLDTSGSMSSLPCAVPDTEDSCGLISDGNSYFITQLGYDPNKDYGYSSTNPTCFDTNVSPGQAGCFYGGTDPNQAHVYINGYFAYNTVDTICNQIPKANSGEPASARWYDCGTINYFCTNETVLGIPAAQCINDLTNYGYQYAGTDTYGWQGNAYWGKHYEAYFSGNLLEFYPPKFVVTRKVMSDLIAFNSDLYTNGKGVRIGVFSFDSTGAETDIKIYPPCAQLGSNPTPGNYLNTLYGLLWDQGTPLAGALVQVGSYFANNNTNAIWYNDLACGGDSYCANLSGANLGSACSSNDSWCGCYDTSLKCEQNYVIVVTDGSENAGPTDLPSWPIGSYQKSTVNESNCSSAPGGSCNIDEVAGFLYANSIRPSDEATCTTNIDTYTMGFAGVAGDGQQLNTYALQRAANLGGGLFADAQNWQQLERSLYRFFASIVQKNRTYGTPSLPQLITSGITNTGTTVFKAYIASFIPKNQNFWYGHLREYTGTSSTTGTITLYDTTGVPFTGYTANQASCSFSQTIPPPIWNASEDLTQTALPVCNPIPETNDPPCYLAPQDRNIYTVTPASSGLISSTTNGATTWYVPSSPALPLGSSQAFTTSNILLSPTNFDVISPTTMDNIINYVIGPKADGIHVLGAIFHSDPLLVSPLTIPGVFNAPDYNNDFLIPLDEQDFLNATYNMPQIVIAGADDGMIHAFDAGQYIPGTAQFAGNNYQLGTAQFDYGTGQEVWAFVPYDLLPKLQYMQNPALVPTTTTGEYWTTAGIYTTLTTSHVYYVDASAYVRNVYLPDIDNGLGLTGDARFWHTVMIIGERLGGTYYICLDITNTMHPKFMWEFTTENMGFTFGEVAPNPAPIGPIWLNYNPLTGESLTAPAPRWVVMLGAGWDPPGDSSTGTLTTNRGRGFYVVDIETGKLVWKFDQSNDANMAYPTPASVANIAPNNPSHGWWMESFLPDLGGQLWQFSYLPKGTPASLGSSGFWAGDLDAGTGLVKTCIDPSTDTNCFWGQRVFAAQDPPPVEDQAQQFFYIPSGSWDPCNNLWIGLAAGDRNDPLSCSPEDYLFNFVQVDPYTKLSSVLTAASNLTPLSGTSGFDAVTCGFQPNSPMSGWDIALDSFSGTGPGTKSISVGYQTGDVIYFGIFTPDPRACTIVTTGTFSCNAYGGAGALIAMAMYPIEGTGIRAGQLIYNIPTGSGIPSAPMLVTSLRYGGGSQTTTTQTPPNPYTIPICGGGTGTAQGSTQLIVANSEGSLANLKTVATINHLMYPFAQVCIPQNEEAQLNNSQDHWSCHPDKYQGQTEH